MAKNSQRKLVNGQSPTISQPLFAYSVRNLKNKKHKMKSLVAFCILTFLCSALAKSKRDDKVKIAVYYESLCPDSKKFITTQLAPVWREFRGLVKVKLVPYGKSTHDKKDNKWQFTCHHGPEECYGNKIQSCILKDRSLQDTEKMELVICLMTQAHPDKSLDVCLEQVKRQAESDKLKRCADGEQGDNLLATFGDKTDAVARPLGFVPTIIINEKFDQALQDETQTDLKGVVCRLSPTKPSSC
ncbi:gamma-interferon-inducible lysosomal thiol reductase-like isoform X1 [Maniola jurtina]|uniref:gamma-interferon-inducible lysosomal thiol reductase-like isoform X1 n=2 Tax=Maniola jurtina TaxID=191418 RepID=UPI001E68B7D1|nr:gamma-interferon-inducible lysosomal thiol reductase-like isoform X1 [Maniola jurtina]